MQLVIRQITSDTSNPKKVIRDLATLEKMLLDAIEGPHSDWTPQDLEDIARRVRANRNCKSRILA